MSKIIKVESSKAPVALGPYSQAVIAGDYIFCSGQIAPKGNLKQEVREVLQNLEDILKSAGSHLGEVVKTEVYLKNLDDFEEMNQIYAEFFNSETKPARVTVEVSKLPKGALIEISCTAYRK